MTAPRTMTGAEVAAALGRSAEWWYAQREELQRVHGFPAPLPGFRRPTWSAAAVEQWLRDPEGVKALGAAAAAGRPLPPRVALDLEAELAARARALTV